MQWNIRNKILAAFGIVTIMFAFQTTLNWKMMGQGVKSVEMVRDRGVAGAKLAAEIKLDVVQMRQWLTDINATRRAEGFDDGFDEAAKYAEQVHQDLAALRALEADVHDRYTSPRRDLLDQLSQTFETFYAQGKIVAQKYIAAAPEQGNAFMKQFDTVAEEMTSQLDALVNKYNEHARMSTQKAINQGLRSRNLVLLFAIVVIVLTIAISFILARRITRPLATIAKAAEKIAIGDIDQHIDHQSGDESGILANAFRELIGYINGVASAADALSRGDLDTQVVPKSGEDILSQNFSRVIDTLRSVISETRQLVQAINAGQLDRRGDVKAFQGGYRELIQALNDILEAMGTPIRQAATALERVAARDLRIRMQGDCQGNFDAFKQALNTAVENLDAGLAQVVTSAEQVALASGQISRGSQALAQGASEQASTLQQVSSSLQEMASMSQQNAANAQETRSLAESARQGADQGIESMQRLSQAIDQIKAASDETAKVVKTIDEIAFQTNLLALNAAVEAARAGDAGKGFAVVAEEVRNLAMRSAEAAKDTAQLIDGAVQKAGDGVILNQEVLGNLHEIVGQVHKVSEVMNEIATASEQQQQGVEQLNAAVEQLNQVTRQTAANSEEAASTAEELSSQAAEMQHLVGTFQLSYTGKAALQLPTGMPVGVGTSRGHEQAPSMTAEEVIPFDDDDSQTLRCF